MALVGLDGEAITDWAAKHDLAQLSFAELAHHAATHELIDGYIGELNEQLNRWEQLKAFAILDRELSVASGDLTPSMKAKRAVIVKEFAPVIAHLYERATPCPGGG